MFFIKVSYFSLVAAGGQRPAGEFVFGTIPLDALPLRDRILALLANLFEFRMFGIAHLGEACEAVALALEIHEVQWRARDVARHAGAESMESSHIVPIHGSERPSMSLSISH